MKKTNFPTLLIISILLTFGLSVSLQSVLRAWVAPTQDPPDGGPIFTQNWENESGGISYASGNIIIGGNLDSPPALLSIGSQFTDPNGQDHPPALLRFDNTFDQLGDPDANKIILYQSTAAKYGLGVSTNDFDLFSGDNFRFYTQTTPSGPGTEAFTILSDGSVSINNNLTIGGTLDGGSIGDESITGAKIDDGTLSANDLGSNSVGSDEIIDGSVGNAEMIDNPQFSNLTVLGLLNCGTINTDASGNMACGTDNVILGCNWTGWKCSAYVTSADGIICNSGNSLCRYEVQTCLYCNNNTITDVSMGKRVTQH